MLNRTAAILVSLSEAFFHCEAKGGRGGGVGGGRGSAGVGVYSGEGMMDFLTKKNCRETLKNISTMCFYLKVAATSRYG